MDEKRQILLGSEDILSRSITDLYINVNLNPTFSEIRDGKIENIFDVQAQFVKERNTSRDFRVYGIIDSTINDCDNLTINAYNYTFSGTGISSGNTTLSGFVTNITSTPLVYSETNVYGFKRGKFLLELTGYTSDFLYLQIPTNNITYTDQIFPQQLIFRDADGVFVNYGTQTIEVDNNGNAIQIDNNFYFLYNKHWVKKDLSIVKAKQAVVSFSSDTYASQDTVVQSNIINDSFAVVLDNPSPFGLEKVDLYIVSNTLPLSEVVVTDENNNPISSFPTTLSFAQNEQVKTFFFNAPLNNIQQFTDGVTFGLKNYQTVVSGNPSQYSVFVNNITPRNRVLLNFQNIFQNRNYFTGIVTAPVGSPVGTEYNFPMPSVLRNGLFFEGTPMEFYPSDSFNLTISNAGEDTILPINQILGINSEQIFPSAQQLSFNISPQYQNLEKHTIQFNFSNINLTTDYSSPYTGAFSSGFTINGVPIVDYSKNYKIDFEKFLACLTNQGVPSLYNQNISGWKRYNLDIPFDVSSNTSALTITITAKSPGTRLDVVSYGSMPDIFNSSDPALVTLGITATTLQNFVYSAQTPLQILLGANDPTNTIGTYSFTISKPGYNTMQFTSIITGAATGGTPSYLVSGYNNILRNYSESIISSDFTNLIRIHDQVTSNWKNTDFIIHYGSNGFYTATGDTYYNGILLLANKSYDNTSNSGTYTYGTNTLNQSNFGNSSGNFLASFLSSPTTQIQGTSEYFSPVNRYNQTGYFIFSDPSVLYNFELDSPNLSGPVIFSGTAPSALYAYGAINSSVPNTLRSYLEPPAIPSLDVATTISPYAQLTLGYFYGVSTTFYNQIQNSFVTQAFDIIPFSGVNWLNFAPFEQAGVTLNPSNNYMGGFSITHP